MTPPFKREPFWKRSSKGNLFLNTGQKRKLACVFTQNDGGGFGFWIQGGQTESGFETEEQAVSTIYERLGW
jgi:hypothetical protein